MMGHRTDVDDLKDRIAKAVERAHFLYQRSLAIMDRADSRIEQSARRLQRGQALLRHAPQSTPSPRASAPPNRA